MSNQNLIIYQFNSLYQVLKEIDQELNFNIIEILNEKLLNDEIKNLQNYLIITENKILNINNQYVLKKIPIKIKSLDDYIQEKDINQIDILKIDTEGFEYNVIKGLNNHHQIIKLIYFYIYLFKRY